MNGVMKPELERYTAGKGAKIEIVDSEGQQAKLNDQVDVLITKKVSVLAINLVDPASAQAIINKAKAAGIPLILFNKEPTEAGATASYDKVWYVGTNSAEPGIIQGQMMVNDWKANPTWDKDGDGVVKHVLLKGEPGHPDAEARTKESVKAFVDAGINALKTAGVKLPLYGVDALDLAINAAMGKNVNEGTAWTLSTDGSKAVRVPYLPVTPKNYQEFRK
ncbi:MAG: hypothetical protein A3J97_07185 [Spirochaetes bacterium RIFOXYC1_FULL_54_7]|nr:MAG: hypothetical protein A3J97_07185 [Spirochaetes bacterium RIFOXYC1_FULL_54_7]